MDATHAYVAFRPCGHPLGLFVDEPGDKTLGGAIAKLIKAGNTIQRVTIEDARVIGVVYCQCAAPPKRSRDRGRR